MLWETEDSYKYRTQILQGQPNYRLLLMHRTEPHKFAKYIHILLLTLLLSLHLKIQSLTQTQVFQEWPFLFLTKRKIFIVVFVSNLFPFQHHNRRNILLLIHFSPNNSSHTCSCPIKLSNYVHVNSMFGTWTGIAKLFMTEMVPRTSAESSCTEHFLGPMVFVS